MGGACTCVCVIVTCDRDNGGRGLLLLAGLAVLRECPLKAGVAGWISGVCACVQTRLRIAARCWRIAQGSRRFPLA